MTTARQRRTGSVPRWRPAGRLRGWPLPGRRQPLPPPELAERVSHALGLVGHLERREPVLPVSGVVREFLARGRAVVAADLEEGASALVPPSLTGTLHEGAKDVRVVRAPVAADVLALAKFDLRGQVKLRAHYVDPALTIAVAPRPSGRGARDGVRNAVRAHQVVSAHAPGLAPPLLAHGRLGRRVRYLVEAWVEGDPVLTGEGLGQAAGQILHGLGRVHRGHGVGSASLSDRWGADFHQRWDAVRASGLLPDAVGARVADLITADRELRISWTHGDLVASNVLRTPDGEVLLVDWEHAHEGVIMQDAAKLHLFSAAGEHTLDRVLDTWRHDAGPWAYTVEEEMVLAHARLLSRYPARRADLEGHPRARVYEKQVRRQVTLLGQVLDRVG